MQALDDLIVDTVRLANDTKTAAEAVLPADAPALKALAEAVTKVQSEVFDIAVVGEVNAGKSTLVNAMFFGKPVVPMKATACTAKLSIIEWAEQPGADVTFLSADDWEGLRRLAASAPAGTGDAVIQSAQEVVARGGDLGAELRALLGTTKKGIPFGELADYAAADGRYTPIVAQVHLRYPHMLGRNVRIVDTPGLRDPVSSRSRVTQDYLGNASVVVVALYAGTPMSRDDYDMLKDQLLKVGVDKLVLVLNKIDAVDGAQAERVIAYVEDKLNDLRAEVGTDSTTLLDALAHARALPASGLMALLGRTKGKIEDGDFHADRLSERYGVSTYDGFIAQSGVPEVEATIADITANRDGRARARGVLKRAEAAIRAAQANVTEQQARVAAAIKDMHTTTDELLREQQDWAAANDVFTQRLRRAEVDVTHSLKQCLPNRRQQGDAVKEVVRRMRDIGEPRIERLGVGNAFSSAVANSLNNDLAWAARDMHTLEKLIVGGLAAMSDELPGKLEEASEQACAGLGVHVEAWLLQQVRYTANIDLAPIRVDDLPTVEDTGPFETLFQPGASREKMRARLRESLDAWEKSVESRLAEAIEAAQAEAMREYVQPALDGIRSAGTSRLVQLSEEIARRQTASETGPNLETLNNEALHLLELRVNYDTLLARVLAATRGGEA